MSCVCLRCTLSRQVLLKWALQQGVAVIPKSVTPARIASNLSLHDFTLSEDDVAALNALDCREKYCWDPEVVS